MTINSWRGDALAVAQVQVFTPAAAITGRKYSISINDKKITAVGTGSISQLCTDLKTAAAASTANEWRSMSVKATSTTVTLTGTAGVPFVARALVDDFAANMYQVITIKHSPGGTWTASFRGQTATGLSSTISAASLKSALEALSTIGTGNINVTNPNAGVWWLEMVGAFAGQNVDTLTVDGSGLTGGDATVDISVTQEAVAGTSEVQRVDLYGSPSGGTWTFSLGAYTTAPLAYNISTASFQAALEALPSIGTGNVSVSGTAGSQYDVTFQGALTHTAMPLGIVDARSLTGGSIYADATVITQGVAATNQISYVWKEDYAATQCRISITKTSYGSWSGGSWSFQAAGFSTGSIAYNATDAQIAAAFEGASGFNKEGVIVTSNTGTITIEMVGPNYASSFSSYSVTSLITGGSVTLNYLVNGVNGGSPSPSGGGYKIGLAIGTPITATIARTATASEVQTALDTAFGAGNTTVTALEASGNLYMSTGLYKIEWKGIYAGLSLNLSITDGSTVDDQIMISTYQKGAATGTNEVVDIEVHGSPSVGDFTIQYGDDVSAAIGPTASASSVQTIMRALPSVTSTGVNATNGALGTNPVRLTFVGPLSYTNIDPLVIDDNDLKQKVTRTTTGVTGKNERVKFSISGKDVWGGTATLTYNSHTTASVDWDATASEIQTALEGLADFAPGDITATGGPWPEADITIEHTGAVAETNASAYTATASLKNGVVFVTGYSIMVAKTTTSATGPNHWNEASNWSLGQVPGPSEDVWISDGTSEIWYGIAQVGTFSVNTGTDHLTNVLDDFVNGQAVEVWSSNSLPSGLSTATTYYVVNRDIDARTMQLAATRGGDPINITSTGTGTHTIGVRLNKLVCPAKYTRECGLRRVGDNGREYLPTYLRIGMQPSGEKLMTIGQGPGAGCRLFRIDTGSDQVTVEILNSGSSRESPVPAVVWKGAHASNVFKLIKGDAGIAVFEGETATLDYIEQRAGTLLLGNITFNRIDKTGGTVLTTEGVTISQKAFIRG